MKTQNVSVVSIHPDPDKPLTLDIKHILAALAPRLLNWIWYVRGLDWLGEDADAFCQRVDAAAPNGLWLTSDELLDEARKVDQTIEGTFLAFPAKVDPNSLQPADLDLREFPTGLAEFAVTAVDGGFFEVYAKDQDIVNALRGLGDVHEEDVDSYF